MCRKDPSESLLLILGLIAIMSSAVLAQNGDQHEFRHIRLSNADRSASCMNSVLGKPTVADVDEHWLLDPCPRSRTELVEALNHDGLRLFDAGDFAFVISSRFFPPLPPGSDAHWPQLKWNQIRTTAQIKPAQGMAQAEADHIGRQILQRARLIPLNVSEAPDKDGTLNVQLNINLYQDVSFDAATFTSVIALINQLPVDGERGRFVYGEIRNGRYVMLWDSPLFCARGNPDFADVNGDGQDEILFWAHTSGNMAYPILVIFDKNGRELTRGKDANACANGREGWACEIEGADISLENAADGKKEIQVSGGTDGKSHVFRLVDGVFVAAPPFGAVPQAEMTAESLNHRGMQLMKERDYMGAASAFTHAADMADKKGTTTALFSNNAGFAYYKAGHYEDSVAWIQKAIEADPGRAVAYLNLGDALVKLNRRAEARRAYTKYLELAPNSKSASEVKKKLEALTPSP